MSFAESRRSVSRSVSEAVRSVVAASERQTGGETHQLENKYIALVSMVDLQCKYFDVDDSFGYDYYVLIAVDC